MAVKCVPPALLPQVMSEINLKLDKLKEIDAQLATMPAPAATGAAGRASTKDTAAISSAPPRVTFSAPLALRPEEQPEMREVWGGVDRCIDTDNVFLSNVLVNELCWRKKEC